MSEIDRNEYQDLVLVRFRETGTFALYRAPGFCALEPGDLVDVNLPHYGMVICRESFRLEDPRRESFIKACGAGDNLARIKARVDRRVFEYPGEEEDW